MNEFITYKAWCPKEQRFYYCSIKNQGSSDSMKSKALKKIKRRTLNQLTELYICDEDKEYRIPIC